MEVKGASGDRPGRLLVVEDEQWLREALCEVLSSAGHRVDSAANAAQALAALNSVAFEAALLDLGLPDMDGMELLNHVATLDDRPAVVVLTGRDSIEVTVEAMKRGAESCLLKPVDVPTLSDAIEAALRQYRLTRSSELIRAAMAARLVGDREIVGSHPVMGHVRELITRVATTDSSVVLLGESGTGKGMAARLIHSISNRSAGPFVDLSCAALPANLVESEMFGHERGAFTDAKIRKTGLLEVAHGGTLFLDEVGELDPSAQSKLLKAIEDRSFRRVGGVREVEVDVRYVVATHVDLKQATESGRFRKDLYYRLNVFAIEIPPLRQRGDDVIELAYHFIGELNPRLGRRVQKLADPTAAALRAYSWPGNVRELRNVIERAMILATGDTLTVAHMPEELRRREHSAFTPAIATLEEVEAAHIVNTLQACKGNVKLTASKLGISRSTLYTWIERLGLGATTNDRQEDHGQGQHSH